MKTILLAILATAAIAQPPSSGTKLLLDGKELVQGKNINLVSGPGIILSIISHHGETVIQIAAAGGKN